MKKNESMAEQMVEAIAHEIVFFLDETLSKDRKRRAISMPEIYEAFRSKLATLHRQEFQLALSKAAHEGRVGRYDVLRGPGGGLGVSMKSKMTAKFAPIVEVETVEALSELEGTTTEPTSPPIGSQSLDPRLYPKAGTTSVESQEMEERAEQPARAVSLPKAILPPPLANRTLVIGARTYELSLSEQKILTILKLVFEAKESEDGDILFEGKHYAVEDERVSQYLDNFIFYFVGSTQKI